MTRFESAPPAEQTPPTDNLAGVRNFDRNPLIQQTSQLAKSTADSIFGKLEITGLHTDATAAPIKEGLIQIDKDKPQLIARATDSELRKLSQAFNAELAVMSDKGHHIAGIGWAQNIDESRKCYSQASEMGHYLRRVVANQGMSDRFSVDMGTINEGKGADPRDFYTGNGEHNFIVITDRRDGSKLYGDPWQGINFTSDPRKITGGKPVTIRDFND